MIEDESYRTLDQHTKRGIFGQVQSLTFTPDGKFIVCSARYNAVEIWEVESGNFIKSIKVNKKLNGTVAWVTITPNGQYIITASINGKIKVFDFFSDELVWTFNTVGTMIRVAVSPDGRYIISTKEGYNRIHVLDFIKRECIHKIKTQLIIAIVITSDNNHFLCGGWIKKKIELWNISSKQMIRTFKTKKMGDTFSIAVTSNMKYVVCGSRKKIIHIWDFSTGELINTIEGHGGWVNSVIISLDDKYIISGSSDKTIKIWELETGELVRKLVGHEGGVLSLALSPDGRHIASGSYDETIKLWHVI